MGSRLSTILMRLSGPAASREGAGASDAELLQRFLAARDEGAFEALVRRHGPMVLGVCRRLLRNEHDAEDAFQATFLVLARRGDAVRPASKVGSWLYGVAYRTALEARRTAARRRRKEACAMPRRETAPDVGDDLRPVLDRELSGLPDKYRAPLVLCDLEGSTRKEAALRLGWAEGTVSSRLSRGRELLARRLRRRGLALSAAGVAAALAREAAGASVPPALVTSTVSGAAAVAGAGTAAGTVLTPAAALCDEVVRAMWVSKLRLFAVVLLGLGTLSVAAYRAAAAPQAGPGDPAPRAVTATPARVDGGAAEARAEDVSVKELPPVVVQTVPRAGDTEVDAAKVTEVRATFSKDMTDESWSWSQISDESFPKVTGKIRYDKDRRTCILPVKLEPGKTYVLWLNSEKFTNFKDADGRSAVPYLLVFETKPVKK